MLTLLLAVLILGVVAYVIQHVPMPEPFRIAAYALLVIFLLLILFRTLGVDFPTLQ